jgi:predicted transcriptional regulator
MSNEDTGKLSTDDAIMDYLSKKGSIIDQTEKLAIARISTKMEISLEQAQTSINSLSAKNLIRKIYPQGKIGFEITPRGKQAIEEIAKAETERVTKRLQESIQQERKTKLRANAVIKLLSVEDEWQNCVIPNKNLINEVEQEATKLLATTKETEAKQPICQKDPKNYDQEFMLYKPQIEKLIEQNISLTKAINTYAKIKNYTLSMSTDIDNISKAIKKYEPLPEAANQVSQLKAALNKLKSIQAQLESFDKDQITRFEELKIQLAENSRLIESLKKPTHEFSPIRRGDSSADKIDLPPDPECPIKYDHKSSGYAVVEKCSKCGTKRKSTPVTFG